MAADTAAFFGCLVVTKQGRTLLSCAVARYAQHPVLKPASLGNLLATMQDLSGSPADAFVELAGVGVALLEEERVIVGVLCEPSHRAGACLVGRQLLHAFRARFAHLLPAMEAEHAREISEMLSSYTFASATQQSSEAACALTRPQFIGFQRDVVQPLLLHPPLTATLFGPLFASHAQSLRAFLLEPKPPPQSTPAVIFKPDDLPDDLPAVMDGPPELAVLLSARPEGPMAAQAAWAGPHMPPVWAAIAAHAHHHFGGRLHSQAPDPDALNPRGAGDAAGTPTGAATHTHADGCLSLAFPACTDPGSGLCLHAAVGPLDLPPAGGYVVLFYGCKYDVSGCQCKRAAGGAGAGHGSCLSCCPSAVAPTCAAFDRARTVAAPSEAAGTPRCVTVAQSPPEVWAAVRDVAGLVQRCFPSTRTLLVTPEPGMSRGAAKGVPSAASTVAGRVSSAAGLDSAGAALDSIGTRRACGDCGVGWGASNGAERARANACDVSAGGSPAASVDAGVAGVDDALAGVLARSCGAIGDGARSPVAAAGAVSPRSAPFDVVVETPRSDSAAVGTAAAAAAKSVADGGDRATAVPLDWGDS